MNLRGKRLEGTFLHAPRRGEIEVLDRAVIAVDERGVISSVGSGDADVVLPAGMLVLPGLVDLHVHAPQYAQLGQALDVPLEVWLRKYTFPLEAKFAALDFARPRYEAVVGDLIANGTTTALYFATVHLEATKLLADICAVKGQRALIGKVVMDDPAACPDDYRDRSAATALADTRALIDHVRGIEAAEGRVMPVVTPRFIPSCTDEALALLGALVRECGCHVQTHASESDWAHGHALQRYGKTDTEALDGFGLLGRRTVLAHANFLTDVDMERIADRGAAVAHCPISNIYFADSVFPLRQALEKGVHVGLGTDISGGPIASIWEAARGAVQASRLLEHGVDPALPADRRGRAESRIDMATAFHLATAGGGEALDLPIGTFAVGQKFDALLIDPNAAAGTVRLFGETDPVIVLEKVLYSATRPNIASVWVDGQRIGGAMDEGRSA
ncbi:MAG TPA: guanine deaminase [Devosia sp.]